MNKTPIMPKIFILLTALLIWFSACSVVDQALYGRQPEEISVGYQMISVDELYERMKVQDIFLINVHIPLEGNIPGTDLTMPYHDVRAYLDDLPADRQAPIYLYCQSDAMGHTAARTLSELGYINIWNLEGGYTAWQAAGLPFE